jgi:K+-sensing histidine kinase KdpD
MRIGTRLWLAILPAVVGILTLAGLAYWGEFGRQAPGYIIGVATLATLFSAGLAWWNTRDIAHRIERLASETSEIQRKAVATGVEALKAAGLPPSGTDELANVGELVQRLASAAVAAEQGARNREQIAEAQVMTASALVRAIAADVAMRLDEIRLPLQILLDNHFGDLNDNQEEMLGAARAAADASADAVRRTITVLTASDGTLALRHDRLHGGELVDGLLGPARTLAVERHVQLEEAVVAPLPGLYGDRALLQDALRTVFTAAVGLADPSVPAKFSAAQESGTLRLSLAYKGVAVAGMPQLFSAAIVSAHRGTLECAAGIVRLSLPV